MGKKKSINERHAITVVNVGNKEPAIELFMQYLNYYLQINRFIDHPEEIKGIIHKSEKYTIGRYMCPMKYAIPHSTYYIEGRKIDSKNMVCLLLDREEPDKSMAGPLNDGPGIILLDLQNTRRRNQVKRRKTKMLPTVSISFNSRRDLFEKTKAVADRILDGQTDMFAKHRDVAIKCGLVSSGGIYKRPVTKKQKLSVGSVKTGKSTWQAINFEYKVNDIQKEAERIQKMLQVKQEKLLAEMVQRKEEDQNAPF